MDEKGGGNMDEKYNLSCCSLILSACGYKETCLHKGPPADFRIADRKSSCPDEAVCLAVSQSDGFGDMESFLLMKKMFILKECGYWRSRAGSQPPPRKVPEILTDQKGL